MSLIPIRLMKERIEVARQDSDTALFFHLLYFGEMILKLTAAGLVAAIGDDRDRHRYRQLYRLVRADGIGEWSTAIDDTLTGPTAQFLTLEARLEQKELTQRNQEGTWQYDSVYLMHRCLEEVEPGRENMPGKIDGRRWYSLFAAFRNKTRGHGATQGALCSKLAPALERSINLIVDNFHLWRRPWAYLYRNLSKKYRVTRLTEQPGPFDYLRSDGTPNLESGVYVQSTHTRGWIWFSPTRRPLISSSQTVASRTRSLSKFRISVTTDCGEMLAPIWCLLLNCQRAKPMDSVRWTYKGIASETCRHHRRTTSAAHR